MPAIADYEIRRELIRARRHAGLARLDSLIRDLVYLPIDRETWHIAADLWATARRAGKPTAPDGALELIASSRPRPGSPTPA